MRASPQPDIVTTGFSRGRITLCIHNAQAVDMPYSTDGLRWLFYYDALPAVQQQISHGYANADSAIPGGISSSTYQRLKSLTRKDLRRPVDERHLHPDDRQAALSIYTYGRANNRIDLILDPQNRAFAIDRIPGTSIIITNRTAAQKFAAWFQSLPQTTEQLIDAGGFGGRTINQIRKYIALHNL